MTLHLLDPGWSTRIVDLGRPRTRSLGVPVGGAADSASLMLGNALVGNPADAAALEIAVKGPRLQAGCTLACVLFGAPFEMTGTRVKQRAGVTFTLEEGEDLAIGGTLEGMRAYLCVAGGIQTPEILGSRSSLNNLAAGMQLDCRPGRIRRRFLPADLGLERGSSEGLEDSATRLGTTTLRVMRGLQADWFKEDDFYDQGFVVTPASNRMGLRLEGKSLAFPAREMVSEPVSPGAVQVTRDGQCIVLGVDGQTIGGYPKIAQVIAADLDRLGQVRPGQRLTFRRVELDEAVSLQRARQARLAEWILRATLSLDGWGPDRKLDQ